MTGQEKTDLLIQVTA